MAVKFKQPVTLEEGQDYLWQENTGSLGAEQNYRCAPTSVTFVTYCACPAFVIVRDESGKRWRCPRDEIFTAETFDQGRLFTSLAAAIADSI